MMRKRVVPGLLVALVAIVALAPTVGAALSGKMALRKLASAVTRADVETLDEILADDITHKDPDGTLFRGKAAFIDHLDPEFAANTRVRFSDLDEEDGLVTGSFELRSDDVAQTGADRITGPIEAVVEDGKISRFDVALDPDDPDNKVFLAALAGAGAAPSRLPSTGDGTLAGGGFPVEVVLAALGLVVTAALLRRRYAA